MWGKRRKRGSRLSRLLALARLEDAMGRVQGARDRPEEKPAVPSPRRGGLSPERLPDPENSPENR
jgi:hypothetical protein